MYPAYLEAWETPSPVPIIGFSAIGVKKAQQPVGDHVRVSEPSPLNAHPSKGLKVPQIRVITKSSHDPGGVRDQQWRSLLKRDSMTNCTQPSQVCLLNWAGIRDTVMGTLSAFSKVVVFELGGFWFSCSLDRRLKGQ